MPNQHRKDYHKEYMANKRRLEDPIVFELNGSEVDLKKELNRVKEIVRTDIQNIYNEVAGGKLKAASTEALGLYARLLTNMIKEEKDYLDSLTDEELEKLNSEEKK